MILSIETATELCGVALVDKQRCLCERIVVEKNIHSERLMVLVDEVLREAGVTVASLDGVAVSIGPGSFTGLRIGLSAGKGLAYARSLPILAVPTLDAIAYEAVRVQTNIAESARETNVSVDSVRETNVSVDSVREMNVSVDSGRVGRDLSRPADAELICAVIDAKRDEAYFAFYEPVGADDVTCVSTHAIATVAEIASQFPAGKRVFVAGDAAKKIVAAVAAASSAQGTGPAAGPAVPEHPVVLCSPGAVGLLAERRFDELIVRDFSELEPVYIRDFVTTMPRIANHTAIP